MADQSIACPSCGKRITLTRALRAEIETSLKAEFGERERELRQEYERKLEADRERVEKDAAKKVEKKLGQEVAVLKDQLKDQARELDDARRVELALRKREQALERKQADLEVTIARGLADERAKLVAETKDRLADEHRLKDSDRVFTVTCRAWCHRSRRSSCLNCQAPTLLERAWEKVAGFRERGHAAALVRPVALS
jgi:hypothetical protein